MQELVPLGEKTISRHTHNTRTFHRKFLFKIFDKLPCLFIWEPPSARAVYVKSTHLISCQSLGNLPTLTFGRETIGFCHFSQRQNKAELKFSRCLLGKHLDRKN